MRDLKKSVNYWRKLMIKDYGKVSIIVPVYNVEKYFDECVQSLINQTYSNIEIILIDDGTPDKCGEMADEYAKKDCRIKALHKENGGQGSARNYGLEYATGDYYCFVDSDDFLALDYVEKMITAIVTNHADVVFSNYYNYFVNGNKPSSRLLEYEGINEYTPNEFLEQLYNYPGAFCYVAMKFYRKDVFKNLRFKNMLCEDAQLILYIIDNCNKICYIPDVLYYYRRRKSSTINVKQELFLHYEMEWVEDHMKRLKETNRMHLYALAQKLYISKILGKYCYCKKETRKRIRNIMKKHVKQLVNSNEFNWKIKLKYRIVSRIPYLYGKYYDKKIHDYSNIFWE